MAGDIGWFYFREFLYQFIACALALSSTFAKAPGPFAAEERCFTRADWRSTWVAERQVCSVVSLSPV